MSYWNSVFKITGRHFFESQEDMKKIVSMLKKNNVQNVLDLGCGSGRHTVMLAKNGFKVFGMDISEAGLKLTREWLKEYKLKAKLIKASCYKRFPYKDNFFDALVSIQVIHHAKIKDIRYCLSEIKRVVKKNGIIFITMSKENIRLSKRRAKIIAPRTHIMLKGHEKGVPHYIFTKALIKKEFKEFEILDIHLDSGGHYCLLVYKK